MSYDMGEKPIAAVQRACPRGAITRPVGIIGMEPGLCRTSDLFNSAQELRGLQPLGF